MRSLQRVLRQLTHGMAVLCVLGSGPAMAQHILLGVNCAAPPVRMCSLPGPWQDSHPLSPGIPAFSKCSRAWGLAGNFRTMSAWQSAQARLPTKCAPGISSGTTTVFEVVEQEIKKNTRHAESPSRSTAAHVRFDFNAFGLAPSPRSSRRRP